MTTARDATKATLLANGQVLITGGSNPSLASAELYDPTTGVFSPASAMSSGRSNHTATRLLDGRVLIAGGDNGNISDVVLDTAETYQ
jgi:hypothetical protein